MQSATSAVLTPVKYVSGGVTAAEYSAFTAVEDATSGDVSLTQLREQNEQLRQSVAQMEEYRQESERLRQLLGYRDAYALEGVVCSVISRSGSSWNNVVTIGKGTADGVRPGLAVVGPAGVVGQVISADSRTAEVRLLQDPQSGVAVLIQSSRDEGIVKGSLDGLLYLQNISDEAKVEAGDVVVTSGLGGSFNRGLIVGTVAKVEGTGPSRKIIVEPNETTGPLQEVMVVTGMESEGALDEEASASQSADEAQE